MLPCLTNDAENHIEEPVITLSNKRELPVLQDASLVINLLTTNVSIIEKPVSRFALQIN